MQFMPGVCNCPNLVANTFLSADWEVENKVLVISLEIDELFNDTDDAFNNRIVGSRNTDLKRVFIVYYC